MLPVENAFVHLNYLLGVQELLQVQFIDAQVVLILLSFLHVFNDCIHLLLTLFSYAILLVGLIFKFDAAL